MKTSRPDRSRVRQACEPCRRKKTKCPGERPVCSYCTRLKQSCIYLAQNPPPVNDRVQRVAKTKTSASRVKDLEAQVNQMRNVLESFVSSNGTHTSTRGSELSSGVGVGSSPRQEPQRSPSSGRLGLKTGKIWSSSSPEPPPEVVDDFVAVYASRIYFQPLPQFNTKDLRSCIDLWPSFLRYSFYALLLHHTDPFYYSNTKQAAIAFYTESAQKSVDALASQGIASVQIIHSLCLLSLVDIVEKRARAWINIGTAARLVVLRRLAYPKRPGLKNDDDAKVRCYWSVFFLEKSFSPQFSVLTQDVSPPEWPESPPSPPPTNNRTRVNNLQNFSSFRDRERGQDDGINAYAIQAASIWGGILSFLQAVQSGEIEKSWAPTSCFSQLTVKLYDLDTGGTDNHALRLVRFHQRTAEELQRDAEYWRPWLVAQFLFHGCQSVLHHPFVHLLAARGNSHTPRAPSFFIQRTIDQAMFHSAWVARMIDLCEAVGCRVDNPLIGHLVAATMTIFWVFQFAPDPSVSAQAIKNIGKCESFLQRLSRLWPHFGHQLENFQLLQGIARQVRNEPTIGGAKVTFQARVMWTLLSPNIAHLATSGWDSDESLRGQGSEANVTLEIATSFVHPVADKQPQVNEDVESMAADALMNDNVVNGESSPELSLTSLLDDFYGMDLLSWQQFNFHNKILDESMFR